MAGLLVASAENLDVLLACSFLGPFVSLRRRIDFSVRKTVPAGTDKRIAVHLPALTTKRETLACEEHATQGIMLHVVVLCSTVYRVCDGVKVLIYPAS